ncbi:hypothetical protein A3O17_01595 [Ligilactobacillus aviarius]|uniref:signal recognition particle-docking protein FtsY n=1 Tax=Ligilactobacillus aviarius TaxID=1606 RepID=UPI0007D9CFB2|nr:signal recognition particle-docking protein FtsY [Ligilactobacillus aviarius]OAQ06260.1 hypothetical protein A3O15_02625 [Ligilactobacillus aviarius]OAS74919.1 hypothetical protein A3O17_01595 [Ligilactobacillus aviarius]
MGLFDKLKKAFGFTSDDDEKVKQDEKVENSTDQAEDEDKKPQAEQTEESSSTNETENEAQPETEDQLSEAGEKDQASAETQSTSDDVIAEPVEKASADEDSSTEVIAEEKDQPVIAKQSPADSATEESEVVQANELDKAQPAADSKTETETKSESADDDWEITTQNANQATEEEDSVEQPAATTGEESPAETAEKAAEEETEAAEDVAEHEGQAEQVEKQAQTESETRRYTHGLKKTRTGFKGRINALLANFRHVDEDFFDDLEEMLIESDVGFEAAMKISDELRDEVKFQNAKSKAEVSEVIVEKLVDLYEEAGKDQDEALHFAEEGPTVFLFVGVNGVGKTTTIGKLAKRYKDEGKKVMVAAGDTFRAGAIQQLDEWAQRVGVTIVKKPEKSDPASVVYDAVTKAKKENYDILLVDTAGRLQNKVNLMNELEKIQRVITREIPEAPHEVLLALDATTGQNALSQAKQFKDATNVTGIILTKLDGTARGGIVLAIRNELHIPVKLVGLGEQVDDLRDFNTEDFAYGLFKGLITPRED